MPPASAPIRPGSAPLLVLTAGRSRPGAAIFWGGLVCGVLDISYVLVFYGLRGADPRGILQGIAFSVLGRATYSGDGMTVALGLALHFGVAFAAAALFQLLSRRLRVLVIRPVSGGLLYGMFFYALMNLVVLRFTLIGPKPFPPANWPVILPAHLLFVGLPIALIARRFRPADTSAGV